MPKFSIVIPTRNRAYTLYYTLKTCLNQHDFDDYEIIVSDNCSDDNTAEMIKEFNSNKIKYFKTDSVLAMTDNYNFAMSKVKGEYALFIGSDEAILTHGLYFLDKIVSITEEKLINWNNPCYFWPDCTFSSFVNNLILPKSNTTIIRNAKNIVKNVISAGYSIFSLPLIYVRSTAHKNIINKLIDKAGFMFDAIDPDIYSGFALSAMVKHYITIGIPVCMTGLSGKSTGISTYYGGETSSIQKEFVELTAKRNSPITGKFYNAGVKTYFELALDDFNCVKKNLNAFSDISIEIGMFIDRVIRECYTKNMYLGSTGREYFQKELSIIKQVIKKEFEFEANHISGSLNIDDYEFYEPIYARIPKIDSGVLQFDASLLGIENIYDATLFAEKLLYSKEYIDAYLNQFEKNWNKSKSNFEWLNKYAKIGIFATGKYTEQFLGLYKYFGTKDIEIVFFDNDKTKWETDFYDYKVLPPQTISEQKLDVLIISSPKFQDEIYESVKQYEQTIEIIKLYDKFGWNFAPSFVFE